MKKSKVEIIEKDGKRYIDGEEILCEYDLNINYTKEILFLIALSIFYFYMKSKNFDVNIGWWMFSFGIIAIIIDGAIKDIRSTLANKVYVTKSYFITANEDKINLDEIYFKYKSYGYFGWRIWKEIYFYDNKFIFYTEANENSNEYKNFINALVVISDNQDVVKELPRYYAKRKLIQTIGEKDGK